jgi:hypothetical protein
MGRSAPYCCRPVQFASPGGADKRWLRALPPRRRRPACTRHALPLKTRCATAAAERPACTACGRLAPTAPIKRRWLVLAAAQLIFGQVRGRQLRFVRDGQTSLGSSSLVAHVLPYPPPPHVNSFVLGPAVINTHTHTGSCNKHTHTHTHPFLPLH